MAEERYEELGKPNEATQKIIDGLREIAEHQGKKKLQTIEEFLESI